MGCFNKILLDVALLKSLAHYCYRGTIAKISLIDLTGDLQGRRNN